MNKTESANPQRKVNEINVEAIYISPAKHILRGKKATPEDIFKLAKSLKEIKSFNYARRILEIAAGDRSLNQNEKLKLEIHQQWSLCTQKDNDLPADSRLDQALEILQKVENLAATRNQETLGLVGGIYKRKWEVDNQKQQLERSLLYYMRGYEEGAEKDQGFTGINAAFVLDLLSFQEEEEAKKASIISTTAGERREDARRIREDVATKVAPLVDKPENRLADRAVEVLRHSC